MDEFGTVVTINRKPPARDGLSNMILPFILFLAALYFWDTVFVLPIKYLTVFFHELSHALAALFTGGGVQKIEINFNQGGVAYTYGGIRFIILSAGYLGSLLWGSFFLVSASKTNAARMISAGLGMLLFTVSLIWVRNLEGWAICLPSAIAFFLIGLYCSENFCNVLLKFFGLTSCFYVLIDIKEDLIDRTVSISDAARLGEMMLLPGWVVGIVWLLIAIWFTYGVISHCITQDGKNSPLETIHS